MSDGGGRPLGAQALGELGEKIAARWWQARGARVLARNHRAPGGGEVDLVVREGRRLIFVEVKTRRAGGPGRPLEAVNREKRRLMRRGGEDWLRRLGTRQVAWRYDVLEVLLEEGSPPVVRQVENVLPEG